LRLGVVDAVTLVMKLPWGGWFSPAQFYHRRVAIG
jgi:hypothetical protein